MDLYSNLDIAQSLVPAARTASGNGTEVDIRGYHGAMVVIQTGLITDGTHTIEVKEADAPGGAFTAVADGDLQGTEPAIVAANDNVVFRIGYKGTRGALRVDVTVAGATTGGVYSASVIRGHPRKAPVAERPDCLEFAEGGTESMKIQMVTLLAGPDLVLQPGQIADLPAAQAEALVKGGFARPVKKAPPAPEPASELPPDSEMETAVDESGETAVQPRGRGGRGGA